MLNFRPRSAQEIVQDAVSKIGNTKYNMFWQNCEHFATYCRYGVNSSQQVCYFNLQIINNCIKALIGQAKYLGKIQWTCVCDIFFLFVKLKMGTKLILRYIKQMKSHFFTAERIMRRKEMQTFICNLKRLYCIINVSKLHALNTIKSINYHNMAKTSSSLILANIYSIATRWIKQI